LLLFIFRLGETCSHVGALLFKIEAAVRLGYTTSACTDVPCVWNACFVKDVEAAPISEIKFYKDGPKEKLKSSVKKRKTLPVIASEERRKDFLVALSTVSENIVGLSAFKEFGHKFMKLGPTPPVSLMPQPLRDLYRNDIVLTGHSLQELCTELSKSVAVSDEEVAYMFMSRAMT